MDEQKTGAQDVGSRTIARTVADDGGGRGWEIPAGGPNRLACARIWDSGRGTHVYQVTQWLGGMPLVSSVLTPAAAQWVAQQMDAIARHHPRAFQPAHATIDLYHDSLIDQMRQSVLVDAGYFGTADGLPCGDEDRAIIAALDARTAVPGVRCGLCSHYVLSSADEQMTIDLRHRAGHTVADLRQMVRDAVDALPPDGVPGAYDVI